MRQVGWQPADVQLVAVSIGPGSFTGLRVGVTAAKVFAYAVGAEALGVNTLEAIAANYADTQRDTVSVVIDAQRGEVVVQPFVRRADGWFESAGPEELLDADAWLARISLSQRERGPSSPAPASSACSIACRRASWHWTKTTGVPVRRSLADWRLDTMPRGARDDLWKLVPHYYRRSAAEEKWDARGLSQFSRAPQRSCGRRKWDCPP